MISVDTNVVLRLLVKDDPEQERAARLLFASGPVWIAKTVLLEAEWVMRSFYRLDEVEIRAAFLKLLGLNNVQVEDELSIVAALALAAKGIQLADAIHLVSRPDKVQFVTFDRTLIRRAKRAGVTSVSGVGDHH